MVAGDELPGLTGGEVAQRLADGRGNDAPQPTSRTVGDILRENVFTLFNAILTACFAAVLLLGDLRDGLFYGVVLANALIGIVQEVRAKVVLDRLALLSTPEVAVKRDGRRQIVPLAGVVLDDILVLRPGDQVPADARVLGGDDLVVDEAMLTGESEPQTKVAGDLLLSGSHVAGGTGYGVVTAVGAASYANKLTVEIKRHSLVRSELRAATNRILVLLSWILGPVIVITLLGRVSTYGGIAALADFSDGDWRAALRDAVASVVGMIPEGLVLLISLAFGVAAIQLARHKVLIEELAAVEVLARVDVLCLDKTGTLTSGELVFDRLVLDRGARLDPTLETGASRALGAFGADDAANLTARVLGGHFSTDGATVRSRLPFGSARKYSGVALEHRGEASAWLLGAPERLLAGHPDRLAAANDIAAAGERTLALVRLGGDLATNAADPTDQPLTPAALVVFRESVRPHAAETLRYFAGQGVRVIVMSGDNPVTVAALARRLGLAGETVNAAGLADDAGLAAALGSASLFGRVSPEQKRKAVAILQAEGRTVAMTGDGVNDAMAIKDADLGIAMGTATPATKAASRLVLLDNRFDRLPEVLYLGRRVIANVERVANLFLSKTVYGILIALTMAALSLPFPFLPRQLTLVSALAIGIPSFVLALAPNRRIYTPGVLRRIIRYAVPTGMIAAATVLTAFLPLYPRIPLNEARSVTTVALFVVSLAILAALARPLTGPRLALVLSMAAAMVLACSVPFGRIFFAISVSPNPALAFGIGIGLLGAAGIELMYRFARRRGLIFDRE
ncbi:HAD family hydrolase [Cryobacterium algoritolerans]|uniref:HAD family hydrolase n=1 Tax=Cryobacterium algoritolerans TaxID=1259184 RepID=A0A4R8WSI7_9MICO|nr:HAD-IC family P-type ATPase [Cryobacterium algoritolerans]TFC15336.1 HAD family hydrolase [Cryobacterium algoritolerans]